MAAEQGESHVKSPAPGEWLEGSWCLWTYPFLVDAERPLHYDEDGWQPWARRFGEIGEASIREESRFFVPPVRALLYGEVVGAEAAAHHVVRHATWHARNQRWQVRVPVGASESVDIEVEQRWCDLWLFPAPFGALRADRSHQAIGFVVTRVDLMDPTPARSLLLAQAGKYVLPPRPGWELPVITVPGDGPVSLEDLLEDRIRRALPQDDGHRLVRSDFGATLAPNQHQLSVVSVDPAWRRQADDLFGTVGERIAFEHTVHAEATGTWAPSRARVEELRRTASIDFWDNWSGIIQLDHLAIIGDAPRGPGSPGAFFSERTANSIEMSYLPIQLLSLYQTLSLHLLIDEAVRLDQNIDERVELAALASERLVEFHNRMWFEELSVHTLGDEFGELFTTAFHTARLYTTLQDDLQLLSELYEARLRRRSERSLRYITWGLIPASILGSVAGLAALTGQVLLVTALVGVLITAVLAVPVLRDLANQDRSDPTRPAGRPR